MTASHHDNTPCIPHLSRSNTLSVRSQHLNHPSPGLSCSYWLLLRTPPDNAKPFLEITRLISHASSRSSLCFCCKNAFPSARAVRNEGWGPCHAPRHGSSADIRICVQGWLAQALGIGHCWLLHANNAHPTESLVSSSAHSAGHATLPITQLGPA